MNFIPTPIPLNVETKWENILIKTLRERGNYEKNEQEIKFQQVAGVFLGSFEDQEAFEEYLYLLANEEINEFECLFHGMDKSIDNEKFQEIQRILNLHTKERLSINRFIAFMDGGELLPFRTNDYYKHSRKVFKRVLELFKEKHGDLYSPTFRRVITDIVKWSWNYLDKWANMYHFEERMPRILWYGNATESEIYFLYYLYLFGCDIIVFHSEGINIFSELAENTIPEILFPKKVPLFEFPMEKPQRKSTIAQKASEELNDVLYNEDSNIYRPWQFREYTPRPITLKTTYDELFILQPEKSMYRHGFRADFPQIEIPNLFSKIVGLTKDREEYWKRINQVSFSRLSHVVKEFPMVLPYKGNMKFHYQNVLDNNRISANKLIEQPFWPYKNLATSFQKGLAEVISRFVYQGEINNAPNESDEEKRLYLFAQSLMIPEPFIKLFQQFDYTQEVPVVVLFNNGNSGTFTREDATLLNLLNELGFDIFLYNPCGQNDIENYLETKHYDIHWLEDISFNEELNLRPSLAHGNQNSPTQKIKSFFKNLFQ